jgi:Na+/proline symporter
MVSTAVAIGATVLALAASTALGIWYSRGRATDLDALLTARGSAGSGMTTASVVASVMGAWILLSPAEAGAAFGGLPAVLGYAVGSAVPLALFVAVGPRIRRLLPAGHSLTEYVLARFGPAFYAFVLLVSLFYMFVFLAAEMTGITLALALVAGVPPWLTAALVGGFVLLYTAYGGLVASIVTDTVQTLVLLPLLALGLGGAVLALGGTGGVHASVAAAEPTLLSPGYLPGVTFGVYVVFAVMGANMLNQGLWQRVWAADSSRSVRRAFAVAGVVVVPMVLLSGLFGIVAAGLGLVESTADAGVSFFLVVNAAFPDSIALVVVVVAVLLVASSADTMFNAITSVVTADLAVVLENPDTGRLRTVARGVTTAVAVGAVVVGAQGYSVLTLFLTADLLGAAVFPPLLLGLYSESLSEAGALLAGVAGLAVGLAYFPSLHGALSALPVLGNLLPAPSFLVAFVGATGLSTALAFAAAAVGDAGFDLGSLRERVTAIEEGERR